MIDHIKYTVDDKTYSLTNNGDGTWSREENAPSIAGNYLLTFIISENGIITTVDSSNSLYETYLQVVVDTEKVTKLQDYVPEFIADISEYGQLYGTENEEFDNVHGAIKRFKADAFLVTSSSDAIERREKFIKLNASGTLSQRKSYLITKNQKGNKLNEKVIKNIVSTISGAKCIVTFLGADELNNQLSGYGMLKVQVLSPDTSKDYKYNDMERAIKPLVPGHIKLLVIKYFALWSDIINNFTDWEAVKAVTDWKAVKEYIPPE